MSRAGGMVWLRAAFFHHRATQATPSHEPIPYPVAVSSADHVRLMDLYQRGLCLQAYQLSETIGPIPAWTGTDARLLAGRLAIHLGALRLTYRMHLLAWRRIARTRRRATTTLAPCRIAAAR